MNRPTHADTILKMLKKGANRNWVERVAYESGIDFDHIRGYDDEFSNKEQNND